MKIILTRRQQRLLNEGTKLQLAIPSPPEDRIPPDYQISVEKALGVNSAFLHRVTVDEVICSVAKRPLFGKIIEEWDDEKHCFCMPVLKLVLTPPEWTKKLPTEWAKIDEYDWSAP